MKNGFIGTGHIPAPMVRFFSCRGNCVSAFERSEGAGLNFQMVEKLRNPSAFDGMPARLGRISDCVEASE